MSERERIQKALETLRAAAGELVASGGAGRSLGGEVALMANDLEALAERPPTRSYKDFASTSRTSRTCSRRSAFEARRCHT